MVCSLFVHALAEISRKFTPTARRILAALKSIYIPVVALRDKLKRIECIKTFFLCSFRNFIQAYNTNAKRFIFQNIRYRGLKDLIFSLFYFESGGTFHFYLEQHCQSIKDRLSCLTKQKRSLRLLVFN